jgi:hypothetical protein
MSVNLDFLKFFSKTSCTLAVPFLQQFQIHMSMPIVLCIAIGCANLLSRFCLKSKEKLNHLRENTAKAFILVITLIYPGLATRVFTVLRCKAVPGVEGKVMNAAFGVKCHEGEHASNTLLAIIFLVVYIFGIPLGVLGLLFKHRKALHDEKHPKHKEIKFEYGGLYLQYDEAFWVRIFLFLF